MDTVCSKYFFLLHILFVYILFVYILFVLLLKIIKNITLNYTV